MFTHKIAISALALGLMVPALGGLSTAVFAADDATPKAEVVLLPAALPDNPEATPEDEPEAMLPGETLEEAAARRGTAARRPAARAHHNTPKHNVSQHTHQNTPKHNLTQHSHLNTPKNNLSQHQHKQNVALNAPNAAALKNNHSALHANNHANLLSQDQKKQLEKQVQDGKKAADDLKKPHPGLGGLIQKEKDKAAVEKGKAAQAQLDKNKAEVKEKQAEAKEKKAEKEAKKAEKEAKEAKKEAKQAEKDARQAQRDARNNPGQDPNQNPGQFPGGDGQPGANPGDPGASPGAPSAPGAIPGPIAAPLAAPQAPGPVASLPAPSSDPTCVRGTNATQDNEKQFVCLLYLYQGQLYTPEQMTQILGRSPQ